MYNPLRIIEFLRSLVNMSDQEVDKDAASESIRENIHFKGPNVIILACAIIIASVGLNVNSIPVIIGAMLISPVMGPILGFGFGLGTRDNRLVKDSLKNFAVMVGISIVASTLYFILSPLNLANPTELLARTNPTLYDVLIALFGGLAGMLEICRRKKGTVLSGVAIATALMPPLCTVGYGISVWSAKIIFGALYLFLINGIFIALATFFTVRYLHFPTVSSEERRTVMSPRTMALILLVIIVPSILTAVRVVKDNNFRIHSSKLVENNKTIGGGFIYDYKVTYQGRTMNVELYLAGEALTEDQREILFAKAEGYGIPRAQIVLHEDAAVVREEVSETEIVRAIYEHSDRRIRELKDSIKVLNARIEALEKESAPDTLPKTDTVSRVEAVSEAESNLTHP